MGTMMQQFGFGSAGSAAQSSMNWGTASTGLNAAGDLISGIGQSQQYGYAAQVAQNNARIMQLNAAATQESGMYEAEASKFKYGQLEAEQKAAQAANGVDVNIGSPAAVRHSTETISAMDAAMIHYNASRVAWGQENEANAYTTQSKLDKLAGSNAILGGLFKAGGTLLSGASSLSGKAAQYQLSGATS